MKIVIDVDQLLTEGRITTEEHGRLRTLAIQETEALAFSAIHFYTQYFERLGASPGSLLVAGLAALGIALATVRYNKSALAAAEDVSPPNQSQPPPRAS